MKTKSYDSLMTILGLMLTINAFFIKRLVDQLDSISLIVNEQREEIALQGQAIDNIKNCLLKQYGSKIQEVRRLPPKR